MDHHEQLYVDGRWQAPRSSRTLSVIDPATEEEIARVPACDAEDVDRAVEASRRGFATWSRVPVDERADALSRIADGLEARRDEIAELISLEMGMPLKLARSIQATLPALHFRNYARMIRSHPLVEDRGGTRIARVPIGVCGLITPWNFPLHQVAGKVAPALAAGCAVVLKPSEVAPLDAVVLAEIVDEAGLPAGVFNLIHGEGPEAGAALAAHPGIDMVSFTGSTRGGVAVARAAAETVKRVTQELGGKSPNLLLEGCDWPRAVRAGTRACFLNSGQACNAPTRMLVPVDRQEEVVEIAREVAEGTRVGPPSAPDSDLGPLVSAAQYERVQERIQQGIDEGARLICGGTGKPPGLERGFYARPTVFADVKNSMTVARREIFGPVLSILPYRDEEEAVEIANDTPYGLAAYVSGEPERARAVALRLRAGQVQINGARYDPQAPFGGFKQSGNGREFGEWGLDEYLETQALLGYNEPA